MAFSEETIHALKVCEDSQLEDIEEQFTDQCRQIMEDLLLQIYPSDHVKENLEYYLTGEGEEICCREPGILGPGPEEQQKADEVLMAVAHLHEFYTQSKHQLFNTCYLFLNAPLASSKRHIEEDKEANKVQNLNMYSKLHRTEAEAKKNPRAEVVVKTQHDIKIAIQKMLAEMAMKAKRLTIVFNGEGYGGDKFPKGSLCLCDDNPMSMDKFVDHILDTWNNIVKKEAQVFALNQDMADEEVHSETTTCSQEMEVDADTPSQQIHAQASLDIPQLDYKKILDPIPPLPSYVAVVFGQCYSHNYGSNLKCCSEWGSKFDIVCLTNPEVNGGKAQCSYTFHKPTKIPGVIRSLFNSVHLELDYFAKMNARVQSVS